MAVEDLLDAGEFKTIEPRSKCACAVPGVLGPEDIVVDGITGIAYVSSYDRRAHFEGTPKQGAIFSFGPGVASRPRELTAGLAIQFRPHGMSLLPRSRRQDLLFVINHPEGGHAVEIFPAGGHSLRHLETVRDDLMISPKDRRGRAAAVLFHQRSRILVEAREDLEDTGLPLSNIVYFDGDRPVSSLGASGWLTASGLTPAGSFLYDHDNGEGIHRSTVDLPVVTSPRRRLDLGTAATISTWIHQEDPRDLSSKAAHP